MKIFIFKPTSLFVSFCLFLLAGIQPIKAETASTDGIVSFTVLTVSNGASYSPKNVLAIWVKDAQGNFVISRKVMAASRKQHLIKWNASSGNNSISAITGATLSNHTTQTISWDCRDLSGNIVPDGTYQIWVEYTSRNSNSGGAAGPSTSVTFTKSTDVVAMNVPDETYFKNMVLNYTPLNVGINDDLEQLLQFKTFPNPFSDKINVSFDLPKQHFVNISVYDQNGKRVSELVNEDLPQGINAFYWDGTVENGTKLNAGLYFLRVVYDKKLFVHKVLITQ
jgi:flagellar hook assembly protein FlgD